MRSSFVRILSVTVVIVLVAMIALVSSMPAEQPNTLSGADMTATALCLVTLPPGYLRGWELFGTPTPDPNVTPSPTPSLPPGDAARGEVLFDGDAACAACHNVESQDMSVGPPLMTIAQWAGERRAGISAEEYLHAVIVDPDGAITPLTRPGIMPRTYAQSLTPQQIADLVAYLLTLGS